MPFTLTMPKLSPTMELGTIAKWHKEGEKVDSGELIIEVSTDKATVEHQALDGGWLRKILIQEGEEAVVNQPIAILSESKEENIEEFLSTVLAEEKQVASPEIAASLPSEEIPKKAVRMEASGMKQPSFMPEPPLENYEFGFPEGTAGKRIKATPLAKKIALEQGLDLTTVKGSGPEGRIVRADLEKAQKNGSVVFGRKGLPVEAPGTYEEEKLSPIRKVISQRMQESKTFIPHFYVSQAIDVEPLVQLREQLSRMNVKVSYNDCTVRACALALREHPNINSGFNTVTQSIIRFKTIDIAVAVSVEEGLITPIIRHADYKNLGEISVEIRSLATKAREGKLSIEEYKGGSFTLSNLGMYGVTDFQAIINPPQAAILAVSGIHSIPVVKGGLVVPGKVMNISLSVDHRVIDGVAAAQFIKSVQKYLENPSALLV